ncbi:MAG: hypothetical protein NTZ74_00915 [Chloroflexi bacterium]|nr:hypothetical protein [Chloroflexota bacterium]
MRGIKNFREVIKKYLYLLFVIEGLPPFIIYLNSSSSKKNIFFLGLSKERLFIGGLFLLFLFLILVVGLILRKQGDNPNSLLRRINFILQNESKLAIFRCIAFFSFSLILSFLLIGSTFIKFSNVPLILVIVINKLSPFLIWSLLILGELLFFLSDYSKKTFNINFFTWAIGIFFWVFFTLIIIFQIIQPFLFQNFAIAYRNNNYSLLKLLLIGIWLFIWAGYLFLISKKRISRTLQVIIPISLFIFGIIVLPSSSDNFINNWKERFLNEPQNHAVYSVCYESYNLNKTLRNYDQIYNSDFWLGTKPPGYFTFYSAIIAINKFIIPPNIPCDKAIASIGVFLFPLMASSNIVLVVLLGKKLKIQNPIRAGLVIASLPNILFFCFSPDQFLYPLFFNLTLLFTVLPRRRIYSLLGGLLIYICVFTSFSLLPLIGFLIIWLFVNFINQNEKKTRIEIIRHGVYILIGFTLILLVVLLIFGYNPIIRYQNAFLNHRTIKNFNVLVIPFFKNILLNNFEFAISIGGPIYIVFISEGIRSFIKWLTKKGTATDLLNLAVFGTFIVLNMFGQTIGEVGRLWIFFGSFISIVVSQAFNRDYFEIKNSFSLLIFMQLVSTVVFYYSF